MSVLLAAERLRRETYAEYASRRLRESDHLTPMGLARSMVYERPILGGAGLLVLVAGVRAELAPRELLLQVLMGTVLGMLVIAIKLALP